MSGSGEITSHRAELAMLDPAPVAVALHRGPQHVLSYTNALYREIYGERPLGVPVREAFPDLRQEEYFSILSGVYENGRPVHLAAAPVEVNYRGGEQRTRYFATSMSAVRTETGDRGVLYIAAEVTEQVTASERVRVLAEERRRALQRYESLVATSTQAVWVADPEGGISEPSASWERVTGQSWPEYRGWGWVDALHPDDREHTFASWSRALNGSSLFQHVYRLRSAAGGYRHVDVRAVPVQEDNHVVEWVGTCADVEEEWREARERKLLARAGSALTESMRVGDAFCTLTDVIVPELADACSVYLLPGYADQGEDSPLLAERVALSVREGLSGGTEPRGEERLAPDHPFAAAVRGRRPVIAPFPAESAEESTVPPGALPWLEDIGAHHVALLPLLMEGTVAAMVTAAVCGTREMIDTADLTLMRKLLEQAHTPLANALRFQRTQRVALALQHSLLTEPPQLAGLEVTARYVASPAAEEVGGDWYDSFVLPDGAPVLIIGDVAGHDLAAAVTMSKMRNMLRGLAVDRSEPPGDVLRRLDTATELLAVDQPTVTCVYARVEGDPHGPRQLVYSNAGHLPPLLVHADGDTRFLYGGAAPLLGVQPAMSRPSGAEVLPVGSTLLLYTDGMVERRNEDIDVGLDRLARHAAELARAPVQTFLDELLVEASAASHDDIAMIALRLPEEG